MHEARNGSQCVTRVWNTEVENRWKTLLGSYRGCVASARGKAQNAHTHIHTHPMLAVPCPPPRIKLVVFSNRLGLLCASPSFHWKWERCARASSVPSYRRIWAASKSEWQSVFLNTKKDPPSFWTRVQRQRPLLMSTSWKETPILTCPRSNVTLTSSYFKPKEREGLCHQRSVPSIAFSTGWALSGSAALQ